MLCGFHQDIYLCVRCFVNRGNCLTNNCLSILAFPNNILYPNTHIHKICILHQKTTHKTIVKNERKQPPHTNIIRRINTNYFRSSLRLLLYTKIYSTTHFRGMLRWNFYWNFIISVSLSTILHVCIQFSINISVFIIA